MAEIKDWPLIAKRRLALHLMDDLSATSWWQQFLDRTKIRFGERAPWRRP